MKKFVVLIGLLVLGLLLVGCANQNAASKETLTPKEAAAQTAVAAQQVDPNAAKIVDFKTQITTQLQQGGNDVLIYPSQSTADANKEGFFVFGIRNNRPGEQTYRISFKPIKAQTIGGIANSLPMDETAVEWFSTGNNYGPYTLGNMEIQTYVFKYKIGDNAAKNSPTQKGNYAYEIKLQIQQSNNYWTDVTGKVVQLAIKYQ